jgi:hypothetical protein
MTPTNHLAGPNISRFPSPNDKSGTMRPHQRSPRLKGGRSLCLGVAVSLILAACSPSPLPWAESAEGTVKQNGIEYKITYDPYSGLYVPEDSASEIVRYRDDGVARVVEVTDVNVPTVSVARVDGAKLAYSDRGVALALATDFCRERGLIEDDAGQSRGLFWGHKWTFYDLCERSGNSRDMIEG